MEQVSYKFISNEKVQICIPLEGRLKLIDAENVVSPDGDRCVVYDNYVVSLQQMWQNATDIDFYLEKIQQAYDCLTDGLSKIDTLKKMISIHVAKFGRVIDSDLMMMASTVAKVQYAITGSYHIENVVTDALNVAKKSFLGDLFITIYHRTPVGIQPSIVPASEYFG